MKPSSRLHNQYPFNRHYSSSSEKTKHLYPLFFSLFSSLIAENFSRFCCGKRGASSATSSSNGRRHLYCMRFATLRAVPPDNDSINATSSYCTSECCSSSCSGNGNGAGMGVNVLGGTTSGGVGGGGVLGCCVASSSSGSGIVGNLPSATTSSSSVATSSGTYSSYRYQMMQQQQQLHYHHPSFTATRNNYIQQVQNAEFYGKNDGPNAAGSKKLFSTKRNLRSSDSVLRR